MALMAPAGCLSLHDARPALESQRDAVERLARAGEEDAGLLRAQAEALIAVRRTMLTGSIHRSFIARGYLSGAGEADSARLETDLADPAVGNALIDDIRAGRLTPQGAAMLLGDYALAARMATRRGTRLELLARLGAVRQFDELAAALLRALDERAAAVRSIARDALESSGALLDASARAPGLDDAGASAARVLWERAVLARIDDEAERRLASELIEDLLAPNEEPRP